MAAQVAQIIDLNAYRQSRAQTSAAPAMMVVPVVYVAWWTMVPVMFVPATA